MTWLLGTNSLIYFLDYCSDCEYEIDGLHSNPSFVVNQKSTLYEFIRAKLMTNLYKPVRLMKKRSNHFLQTIQGNPEGKGNSKVQDLVLDILFRLLKRQSVVFLKDDQENIDEKFNSKSVLNYLSQLWKPTRG